MCCFNVFNKQPIHGQFLLVESLTTCPTLQDPEMPKVETLNMFPMVIYQWRHGLHNYKYVQRREIVHPMPLNVNEYRFAIDASLFNLHL